MQRVFQQRHEPGRIHQPAGGELEAGQDSGRRGGEQLGLPGEGVREGAKDCPQMELKMGPEST